MVSSVQQLNTPRSVPPGRVFAMAWSSESFPDSIISLRILRFSSTEFFFLTPSFGWAEPCPSITILCSMGLVVFLRHAMDARSVLFIVNSTSRGTARARARPQQALQDGAHKPSLPLLTQTRTLGHD